MRSVLSLLRGARLGHGRSCTNCDGETIVSFPAGNFFLQILSQSTNFSRNLSPALDESLHCLGLVVEGNHKLVGCNKGSGDPFVENDQQIGAFSAGNHLPLAVQVRGGEVSQR